MNRDELIERVAKAIYDDEPITESEFDYDGRTCGRSSYLWEELDESGYGPARVACIASATAALQSIDQEGLVIVDRAGLRKLVDLVWQTALEDQSVPASCFADQMIEAWTLSLQEKVR